MISIQKIALEELEEFYNSKDFIKLKNKPISSARVQSYMHNPRANKKDIVLYLAFLKKELVGYRSIWGDTFYTGAQKVSFGWLSGSWVHPEYRRKGISTVLFKQVLIDWKDKLMFTNYAENSKLLYDKTDEFSFLAGLEGKRFYIRFCLADILPKKKNIFKIFKIVWMLLDWVFNLFLDAMLTFKASQYENSVHVNVNEPWNTAHIEFTDSFVHKNLFQRGGIEFNWVQKYPWVLIDEEAKAESKSYYFSCFSKQFESNRYSMYSKENILIGFLLINIRDGHMKIPYAYFYEENSKEVAALIANKCLKNKLKTVIIYNETLNKEIQNQLSFLAKKQFTQKYFMTNDLKKHFKSSPEVAIQSGDGDVVFT
jgi:GNAT superfamily N-acetyltransferase